MSDLPGLIVDVEARITKLEAGLKKANVVQRRSSGEMERRARQSADRINTTYSRMGKGISATFTKMAVPLFAGIASAATVASIGRTTRAIAQMGDEAKRSGVGLAAFQEWKFVAEQNRIGLDQMIDGLKELNIRGDEFAITGKGGGAEAFERLGYEADELADKLKDPSALMLEIIGRMEGMSKAAQIRISDELFGGSAGERFVELLDQGEDGIRRTIARGRDLGVVIDEEMIAKAAELDRKFSEVEARVTSLFQQGSIAAAEYFGLIGGEIEDLEATLENLNRFGVTDISPDLGVDNLADLQGSATELTAIYSALTAQSDLLEIELRDIANALIEQGRVGAAMTFSDLANKVSETTAAFRDGEISADDMTESLNEVLFSSGAAAGAMGELSGISFDGLMGRLGGVSTAMETVAQWAVAAANAIKEIPTVTPTADTTSPSSGPTSRNGFRARTEGLAVTTSPRPQLPTIDASFGSPEPESVDTGSAGGGGGGGGSTQQSDFERELASIIEETAALRVEEQALLGVTNAQIQRGDATDLARTKADLLNAAIQSGLSDTPALRAQIDELANAYVMASNSAELAADKIVDVQAASKRGANSIASVFQGMATGALNAKEAVGQLILQVLKLSLQKRIMESVSGAGGFLGSLVSVIGGGFASGGYTGNGGKNEVAGVVHGSEYVFSKKAVQNIGVGNLENLHNSAKRGYADGGFVGAGGMGAKLAPQASAPAISISAPVTVNASGGTPEQNDDLAKQMSKQLENTLRASIVREITNQMRPGNLLNQGRK